VQEHVLPANILPAEDRPIGDPSFLENSFSLTVTKLKSDIDVNVLFILENFLKLYCTKRYFIIAQGSVLGIKTNIPNTVSVLGI
jgi:hypothetical protein